LFLNIWMPNREVEGATAESGDSVNGGAHPLPDPVERLPVCAFIHGGGYAYGGANDLEIDGAGFAVISDCVVVTIQYRLGAFGFLAHDTFR
jgi:para-nitrobenzyl esterase